jgi:hypothetical protein
MTLKPRENRSRSGGFFSHTLAVLLAACATQRSPAAADSTLAVAPPSTSASTDARPTSSVEPVSALPVTSRISGQGYRCNLVIGPSLVTEWFETGFEELVEDAHWQALIGPEAFVEDWADPGNPVWSKPLRSPCSERATEPERLLFFAVDWRYKSENDWITGLTAAVNALRAHYPSAREIQLLSMPRAPKNGSCGDAKSRVEPFVDQAIARVSGQFESLVRVGPKFEVPDCSAFEKGGPHLSAEGKQRVARLIAAHYAADL